MKCETK